MVDAFTGSYHNPASLTMASAGCHGSVTPWPAVAVDAFSAETMKYRKLRIAWSVVWGIVAVVLFVLWVRSYWWFDLVGVRILPPLAVAGCSFEGGLRLGYQYPGALGARCILQSHCLEDFPTLVPVWRSSQPDSGFGIGSLQRNDKYVDVPHYFAVIMVTTIAVLPRLPFHFSLRTLLIATTLIAVVLGLAVWAAR